MSPQTRRSDTDQLHPLPCRQKGVPPARQWLLPSLHAAPQPVISGGSAHASVGRSLRAVRLHPLCLPPVPPSPSSVNHRDPITPASILAHPSPHPASPTSPLSLLGGGPAVCKVWEACASAAKDASSQCNIRSSIRPVVPSSSPLSAPKFFHDFHVAQLSYQAPLLSLNFRQESPSSICKILSGRYLS